VETVGPTHLLTVYGTLQQHRSSGAIQCGGLEQWIIFQNIAPLGCDEAFFRLTFGSVLRVHSALAAAMSNRAIREAAFEDVIADHGRMNYASVRY
jgi:hypothetical protein